MAIGIAVLIVILVAALIWVVIEVKRVRHKVFAIFLIGLIIFSYISFSVSLNGKNIDWKTPGGWVKAGELYFLWLGSAFNKVKSITLYVIGMDWKEYNESIKPAEEKNEPSLQQN